jgi:threonine aldolase
MGLSEIPGIQVNSDDVVTNTVYFEVEGRSAIHVAEQLKAAVVLVLPIGAQTVRAVTSLAVEADDISAAIDAIREVIG